jgi:hypothetical protein
LQLKTGRINRIIEIYSDGISIIRPLPPLKIVAENRGLCKKGSLKLKAGYRNIGGEGFILGLLPD